MFWLARHTKKSHCSALTGLRSRQSGAQRAATEEHTHKSQLSQTQRRRDSVGERYRDRKTRKPPRSFQPRGTGALNAFQGELGSCGAPSEAESQEAQVKGGRHPQGPDPPARPTSDRGTGRRRVRELHPWETSLARLARLRRRCRRIIQHPLWRSLLLLSRRGEVLLHFQLQ